MLKTESVLISVSIIVTAPALDPLPDGEVVDSVLEDFCGAVAERLGASVTDLKRESWFEEDSGVNFNYLSEENAGHCAKCGRWTSDYDAPDFLDRLMIGKTIEGELLCDECIPDGLFPIGKRYSRLIQDDTEEANSESAAASEAARRLI